MPVILQHIKLLCHRHLLNMSLPYLAAALAGFFDLPAPVIKRVTNLVINE